MINKTGNNGSNFTPYLLTAEHCTGRPSDWIVRFKFESSTCSGATGPTYYNVSGATERASNEDTDFLLAELSSSPPLHWDVYYAGWSRSSAAPTSTVMIHHPQGEVKQFAKDNDAAQSSTYPGRPTNAHWELYFDNGANEGGSSGAPYFDQNGRIVGQHHDNLDPLYNGFNDCQVPHAWGGKFSVSWDSPLGSRFRLKNHLNPSGSNPLTLNGTFRPLNVSLSGPTSVSSGSEGTWTARAGGGNTPGASYTFTWYYRAGSGSWTQVRSITKSSYNDSYTRVAGSSNFEVEARVTRAGAVISDVIQVTVGGGGGEARVAEASVALKGLEGASEFQLAQNYPNPFNPSTEIAFVLPEGAPVKLVVYDVLGKEVARLVDHALDAGTHSVRFDAEALPSGVYIYRIEAGTFREVKHMTLVK